MILYLLRRSLNSSDNKSLCPFCLRLEGLMAMFPEIRHNIEVRYVDFQKPRCQLLEFLGEKNQVCPNLVLNEGDQFGSEKFSTLAPTGVKYIDKTEDIIQFFIERFELL
ncbi:DUF3088 family protein [Grimontia kaedaensis]|uniref:DUF3088 family protein n=1 Tax=Grimontia kaedaensis TaxID=2872157 RepID=A0ABY4X244_9GAMM|nr:DUF3088 family protein [Grimontia kaedaensis]USH05328.1 DUF3088 family protein [Grimontia kaedaensis]